MRPDKSGSVPLLLLLALLLPAACGERSGRVPAAGVEVDPARVQYAPELGVDIAQMERLPSGLYVRDDPPGDGPEAAPGQAVTVHYTGYFPDGRVFDSSRERGPPFEVVIGIGQVIQGWDQGIPGMRVGGRRILVIPPHLAYGESGAGGVIPPNAVLVFDVELLAVQ